MMMRAVFQLYCTSPEIKFKLLHDEGSSIESYNLQKMERIYKYKKQREKIRHTKSTSVPENPSSKQKACSGAVRNMVNRLPFEECEQSDTKGGKRLGERSIATDSPFSASVMTCTFY